MPVIVTIASAGVAHPGRPHITVVGIGADGWSTLPERLQRLVREAEVLLGGPWHLALVPAVEGQERAAWPSPLRKALPALLGAYDGRTVVALASGDPLVSGIGATLVELMGADRVTVEPTLSSVNLARARMRWSAESTVVVSLVGRDPHLLLGELAPGRRMLLLSSDGATPAQVARILTDAGAGRSRVTVLGDLGSPSESRVDVLAGDGLGVSARLNVTAVEMAGDVATPGWTPWLPDTACEHDGQLTKRDLRASALARLAPRPGELLWDVGAGAGSAGIEWMRAHPACRAIAVESHPERAARITRNAANLGVPGLEVVHGSGPGALEDLPAPDAVFVRGGVSRPGVLDRCRAALRPGGRLVAHGVTLQTESLLVGLHAKHGGELTRISVERAEPIGGYTGWTPARAVVQWAVSVP